MNARANESGRTTVFPVKCLLVDDREENLLVLSTLLAADGVEFLQAQSGAAALDLLLAHDVALAILDVHMPEMDGFELAELMRSTDRTRHIPIIFVTAGVRDQYRLFKGYEAGAVDFLYKPIEPHMLRNKAEVFFQLHRQKQLLLEQLQERTDTLRFNEMFAAALGHDLRTPLGAMLTGAELLHTRPEAVDVREVAGRMLSSGRRMHRMIEEMLDLARARLAGGIPVVRVAANVGAVVRRVVQEHQAAFPTRRLELVEQGDASGEWDSDRLAQAAANLIGNALQHGDETEAVRVCLDGTRPDAVTLTVRNRGTIDPVLRPHVFEPFRGGVRQANRHGGLGIGLYIAREIVEAHEGRLDLETASPDHTVFRIELPRRATFRKA